VRACDTWAETTPVKTLGDLGRTIGLRRRSLKLTQQHVSGVTGVAPSAVSRLELGRDDTAEFRAVLLIVNVLGLDIELRPRGSKFTPRPPTKVNELGLSTDALTALSTAGISEVGQLGTASDLVYRPEFSTGVELFEIVCALNRYGLSLKHGRVPDDRNREIFRLRVVDGLTLSELGDRFSLNRERVRQLLAVYFGLAGTPPAARRGTRSEQ
jgi:transcriptional regulator with XRE-family HTH domain